MLEVALLYPKRLILGIVANLCQNGVHMPFTLGSKLYPYAFDELQTTIRQSNFTTGTYLIQKGKDAILAIGDGVVSDLPFV
eukprot:6287667-Amphidinium_carterae.1